MLLKFRKADADVHRLIVALRHPDAEKRLNAAASLGRLGEEAGPAVAALAQALSDQDTRVCRMAAVALGEIGPGAEPAVPALLEALRDENESVRRRVSVALGEMGAKTAASALGEVAVHDPSPAVRKAAKAAVAEIEAANRTGRAAA